VYLFAAYIHPFFLQRNRDPKISVDGPISQVGLEALAVHRYKCSDYTFLDNLMNNWWIFAAKHLPLWIAPNVVTLFGKPHSVKLELFSHVNSLHNLLAFSNTW